MELRYQFIFLIGIVIGAGLLFVTFFKDSSYRGGKKIASLSGIEDSAYFKRKKIIYGILSGLLTGTYIFTILVSFFLLAMPYTTKKEKEEAYKRDIMLCMDVSTSVDELNVKLVDELKQTVNELKGDRFGIVIFNTSGVLIAPLTDDYEYINNMLEEIRVAFEKKGDYSSDDWHFNSDYFIAGTLVGNETRLSSLIGDGLATAVYDFPDLDEDRKRVVIFSTDNDLAGDPIYTLDQAADLCVQHNVTVYGIGTKLMNDRNEQEMKAAVEKTGGAFFKEEEAGTVDSIVDNISKETKNLVEGKTYIREIPWVKIPIIILCISFGLQIVLARLMKL